MAIKRPFFKDDISRSLWQFRIDFIETNQKPWHAHEVETIACHRQEIADQGAEDESVRAADVRLIENLLPFLSEFLTHEKDGFKYLLPDVIDEEDLDNWWFRIDQIARGEVDPQELPEYLRDASAKYAAEHQSS